MKRDDIHFEESVFGVASDDMDFMELPLTRQIFAAAAIIGAVFISVAFGRVLYLNVNLGELYAARAFGNANKEIVLPAARGDILDRFGKSLVKNEPVWSVALNADSFIRRTSAEQAALFQKLSGILDPTESGESIRDIILQADFDQGASIVLDRGLTTEKVINLRSLGDPAVIIQDDYRRSYAYGAAAAHILGYTGVGAHSREIEGRSGLESYYNSFLRGRDGKFIEGRDVRGNKLFNRYEEQPTPGGTLQTTIDIEFQVYLYGRMKEGLEALGRNAGASIALNPQTGEILALASFPGYDNNVFTMPGKNAERANLLNSRTKPLFNRAVSGVYNPGSTWKPVMALAALNEGLIDPQTSVFSSGILELPNPFDASKPSKFLDWKAHGWVNLYSALARSSNVYFYVIGGGHRDYKDIKPLGVAHIENYFRRLGFDAPTGIDLPGEAKGALYGPAERERQSRLWRVGDTYNISIGQGDLAVVPLRLLSFTGGIGTGGKVKKPFLVQGIKNHKGETVEKMAPEDILDFSGMAKYITEVQKGLRAGVETKEGTAHLLAGLPMAVAGKTGSAQILGNTKINAFFVGYAPAENPEIAILILVEDAREGSSNTLPIAHDVLKWYYENRLLGH
jgi:penicillin-binding protein 2